MKFKLILTVDGQTFVDLVDEGLSKGATNTHDAVLAVAFALLTQPKPICLT